jgi:hypothetical protein
MSELPTRSRILLAWRSETEILPRITVMERAKTTDIHEFRHVVDSDLIRCDRNGCGLTLTGAERWQRIRAAAGM